MVKIVIAGVADCPYLARVELLADQLSVNLPDFEVMKIIKLPSEWEDFLSNLCKENLWTNRPSPVVWREPVDFGGMKLLIGGSNEFQEYAHCYYGVKSDMTSCMMVNVAIDNLRIKKEQEAELEAERLSNRPFKIVITRANSAIAYSILPSLVNGQIFGDTTEVTIYLYDNPEYFEAMQGVAMELEDTASPMLRGIKVCADLVEAFQDAEFILILDELRKNPNESKADWAQRKSRHFTNYGELINEKSKNTVKIAVIARVNDEFYSTYAASSILSAAPNLSSSRNVIVISAATYNNSRSLLAEQLEVNPSQVQDTFLWGVRRHRGLLIIDCSQAKVFDSRHSAVWAPMEFSLPVRDLIHNDAWLERDLAFMVDRRLGEKQEQMRHAAALSIGGAIVSVVKHWMKGDGGQRIFTLAAASEGWYGIPEGMFFYIPVFYNTPGLWNPVLGLDIGDRMKSTISRVVGHGNTEYYHVEPSEESFFPVKDQEPSEVFSVSQEEEGGGDIDGEYLMHDFMGLPPSSDNLRATDSTESFQHRRIYQVETEQEPLVEVQFLGPDADAPPDSSGGDGEGAAPEEKEQAGAASSLVDQEPLEVIEGPKDLTASAASLLDRDHPEVVAEVNDLTDAHKKQDD